MEPVQEIARAVLAARARGIDPQALIERLARPIHIDPVEFITSRKWLGLTTIFPGILRLVAMICQPTVRKYHIEIGKGGGKSSSVALVLTYSAAELLTMSDPHVYFGLDPGKPISIINVSTSEAQARTTVFSKLKTYVRRCPVLSERAKIGALDIAFDVSGEFPDGRVLMVCGHSRSEGLEGHDVYAAVLDEANKHLSPAGQSNAKRMFDMLVSSAETRFPKHFRVGTISSSVSMSDFQREEIEALKKRGRRIPWPS